MSVSATMRLAAVAALLAALTASCGYPAGDPDQATHATPSNPPSPSRASESPEAFAVEGNVSDHGFVASSPAEANPPLPAGSGRLTGTTGNFDGAGAGERFEAFAAVGADGRPTVWKARAILAQGALREFDLLALFPSAHDVQVVGAADASGDGRDKIFMVLGHGAYTEYIGIFSIASGSLILARVLDGPIAGRQYFLIHASVRHGSGLRCVVNPDGSRSLVGWGHSTDDTGRINSWRKDVFRWEGAMLRWVTSQEGSSPPTDPGFTSQLACGALTR